MLRNCYAALEYILWLVFSTTLLLCVIVSVDMYLGYIELTKHINSSSVTHKNNSNGQDIVKKNQDAGTSVASDNGEINANKGLHKKHKILGWIPAEHAQVSDVLSNNYDVTYTIDGDGFRTTPSRPDAKHTIYIFGDSFTFGQGVDDEETFSSILSSDWLYEDYKVVNAGVNGYGITQMYGRYLEIEHKINTRDVVIFTPITKDIFRSYKDFAVPAHYLFADKSIETFPYFDNGEIKQGLLDTFSNRIKALLFHAPLTGKISRKLHRLIIGDIDYNDAKTMFSKIRNKLKHKDATFLLYFLPQDKDLARGKYKYDVSRYNYVDIWRYFPKGKDVNDVIGFPDDGHWNCLGHQIAAYAIANTLLESGVISSMRGKEKFNYGELYLQTLIEQALCKNESK